MSPRYQYRWKIELPGSYHRTDKKPSLKGEWVTSKAECYKDFLKQNDNVAGNRLAYLYKRVVLPEHFLVFGKNRYNQYKYKIKAVFYHHEPMWTMYELKWGKRLGKTLLELKKFKRSGYTYVDCCDPIEYLYMRKPFPIENLHPFEPKSVVKEIENKSMDQGIINVKEGFPKIDEKAVQKMVMQEKKEDMEQK